ncbi:MAG: hypothetical protein JW751_01160 [Polyangiaceae bacterium]|nr:hypothetical protein [Polyangiaceae bacterium]
MALGFPASWCPVFLAAVLTGCGGRATSDDDQPPYVPPRWVYPIEAGDLCYGNFHIPMCLEGTSLLRVLEVAPSNAGLDCHSGGRSDPGLPEWQPLVLEQEQKQGRCDTAGQPDCASLVVCEIQPVPGGRESACFNSLETGDEVGYCLFSIQADLDGDGVKGCEVGGSETDCVGSPDLMGALGCAGSNGMLRFVGAVPFPTSGVYEGHMFDTECNDHDD